MLALSKILKDKGINFYQSGKFNLDSTFYESFQDEGEVFDQVFETDHKDGDIISLTGNIPKSLFKYFLDGSRKTYKIGDTTIDNKFVPVVAGQIGVAVCKRNDNGTMKNLMLSRVNVISIFKRVQKDDLDEIKRKIEKIQVYGIPFELLPYNYKSPAGHNERLEKIENSAIATIQKKMSDMEILMLTDLVNKKLLKTNEMLIIDGSLQFMQTKINGKKVDDRLFLNVVGLSKTFNPNLRKILKTKNKEIGTILPNLKFGQRTPVYRYPIEGRVIGAWYLRIREPKNMKNPLDGIVKLEKIAINEEKENGFETGLIDNISKSILLERNVTCYGLDPRWANHIYPIYLTEQFLKSSFLSDIHFLNLMS
ncbi:hypothetical protein [Thermincola potens]|uniref:NurA domain-containing protein n=1 Tax=Thermincola potens (strain JR) TaxID=635013 RepID=D5XAZ3_THEPJ|nr:hypothetical protein [Thermincola potens]ADG81313.1 conserved hypothetical protein [Thermincola potens JR]